MLGMLQRHPGGTAGPGWIRSQRRWRTTASTCSIPIGGEGNAESCCARAVGGDVLVVGVPKTIDNDLACTQATFGFDTAVTVATEAIDRLHSTAESHERIMVVEVMGRYAGWIAMHAGLASGADIMLRPPNSPSTSTAGCAHWSSGRSSAATRHFILRKSLRARNRPKAR